MAQQAGFALPQWVLTLADRIKRSMSDEEIKRKYGGAKRPEGGATYAGVKHQVGPQPSAWNVFTSAFRRSR